jgi:hypothetical protein
MFKFDVVQSTCRRIKPGRTAVEYAGHQPGRPAIRLFWATPMDTKQRGRIRLSRRPLWSPHGSRHHTIGIRPATRNPLLLFRLVGEFPFRFAHRKLSGLLLFQLPPRNTRRKAPHPARAIPENRPLQLDSIPVIGMGLPGPDPCASAGDCFNSGIHGKKDRGQTPNEPPPVRRLEPPPVRK